MAKILTKPYRTFTPFTGELPDPLHDYEQSTTYHYNDLADEFDTASGVVSEIVNNGLNDIPSLPTKGTIEKDALYIWNDIVVRARQTHERTIYDPTTTPALFTIYREETVGMQWIAGEKVDIGTVRIYKDIEYHCIQAHQTQEDWTPDKTPTLWAVVAVGDEWATGVAYKIGDIVTYNSKTYSCLQAHTSQIGWNPAAVPALWKLTS